MQHAIHIDNENDRSGGKKQDMKTVPTDKALRYSTAQLNIAVPSIFSIERRVAARGH